MNAFLKTQPIRSIVLTLLITVSLSANAANNDSIPPSQLVFELPLLDLPYQIDAAKTVNNGQATLGSFFKGYANPSMHQSVSLSTDLYTGLHYGIDCLFSTRDKVPTKKMGLGKLLLYIVTLESSDFIAMSAPGFSGWTHEEYHRAVMTRYHVNSFDDMNKFPIGSETVSVSHVTDEDLIRFKSESPADFNRMHVAGIEGEYLMVDKLQRNNFYYHQNLMHEMVYLLSTLNSIMYVQMCSIPEQTNPMTESFNAIETTIAQRDFTGLDFAGWAYDLFKPNEPYTERGIHPLGNGIDRYIKTSDLTSEELSYLKKQGNLQWLNCLSPMLIGFRSIKLTKNGLYGNFAVRNYLTSFGNELSCNVYLKNNDYNFFVAYHHAQNYEHAFPSIETQLIDYKKNLGASTLYFSPRLLIGLQPKDQGFKTSKASLLGLAECKLELITKGFIHPYIEVSAKTSGWVAGNEFLSSNISGRIGIVSRFTK
jgi:hypothetical protein